MAPPKRSVFMGSDLFSLPVLQALLGDGGRELVDVVGVVTQPDRPAGRGRKLVPGPIKQRAIECGIPVLQPLRLRDQDAQDEVLALKPEVLVVASFGQILPRSLLEAPTFGSLNLHPSLLPRHRGPSPIISTILYGDAVTGTTLMLMSPRMDAGPILAQEQLPVPPGATTGELSQLLAELSGRVLIDSLPAWFGGELKPRDQDDARATYTPLITKEQARVNWTLPAVELERRVRAYNPWPVAHTRWSGKVLRILRASAVPGVGEPGEVTAQGGGLAVGTAEGLLALEEVQLAGGKSLPVQVFRAGHRDIVGARLGEGA